MIKLDKNVQVGDYVLVSRWSDHTHYDPWCVGTLENIKESFGELRYKVKAFYRYFPHCWKITLLYGKNRIRYAKKIGQFAFEIPYDEEVPKRIYSNKTMITDVTKIKKMDNSFGELKHPSKETKMNNMTKEICEKMGFPIIIGIGRLDAGKEHVFNPQTEFYFDNPVDFCASQKLADLLENRMFNDFGMVNIFHNRAADGQEEFVCSCNRQRAIELTKPAAITYLFCKVYDIKFEV